MRFFYLFTFGLFYLLPMISAANSDQPTQTKRYALIIANNRSLDHGVAPLRYADDDGARYYELFKAAGVNTSLLAVLDSDVQQQFPQAAATAEPPKKKNLEQKIKQIFTQIEADIQGGATAHFYFVYAGHGNVGPNQEGYFNLLDSRFGRSELYADIIAKSPATFNHIILDACHAWFMVNKRGGKADKKENYRNLVQNFLQKETLEHYPNTGVILAASSQSETHEWQRFESGIFSHELRSALLGAGDVNNDGSVTYAEAAAFVEAANAGVKVPKARLNVFYHQPAQRIEEPLISMDAFTQASSLVMSRSLNGKYYIEDARGIRLLDLHYSAEQPVTVKLIGTAPYYIKRTDEETIVDTGIKNVELSELEFYPVVDNKRGTLEDTFRKHLFAVPFGLGFFRGTLVNREKEAESFVAATENAGTFEKKSSPHDGQLSINDDMVTDPNTRFNRIFGWTSLAIGVSIGAAGAVTYGIAHAEYSDYEAETDQTKKAALRSSSEDKVKNARILASIGGGLFILGGSFLISNIVKKRRAQKKTSVVPFGTINPTGAYGGFVTEF